MEKKKIKRKKKGKSIVYFGKEVQASILVHQDLNYDLIKFKNLQNLKKEECSIDRYVKNTSREQGITEEEVLKKIPENFLEFPTEKDCASKIKKIRKEQQIIYQNEIHPAFDKLVENLIFIHNFTALHDHYEDLKADCISFLYQVIPKFDRSKNYKAFSYFNIVAKHFLMIKSKIRVSKTKRNVSMDDPDAMTIEEKEMLSEMYMIPSPDDTVDDFQFIRNINSVIGSIKHKAKNELEVKCVNAIEDIFKNLEKLDLLNKRAVFQYIRDHSGLNAKQLTTTMSIIKKYYKDSKKEYLNT